MKILRLRCPCTRNLADVSMRASNPDWTVDKLTVTPRPNVDQREYRPWDAANRNGVQDSDGRAVATPGRIEGRDWDWHDRTYVWPCRCGRTYERRHERISEAWSRLQSPMSPALVVATLDVDV